jgi:hypothetical protein
MPSCPWPHLHSSFLFIFPTSLHITPTRTPDRGTSSQRTTLPGSALAPSLLFVALPLGPRNLPLSVGTTPGAKLKMKMFRGDPHTPARSDAWLRRGRGTSTSASTRASTWWVVHCATLAKFPHLPADKVASARLQVVSERDRRMR